MAKPFGSEEPEPGPVHGSVTSAVPVLQGCGAAGSSSWAELCSEVEREDAQSLPGLGAGLSHPSARALTSS